MKRIFFNAIALMVLVSPLLMATKCAYTEGPPNTDLGCEISCVVWINYVDENGAKVPFGTTGYPDTVRFAYCQDWVDAESGALLTIHDSDHEWLPNVKIWRNVAHAYILAAPARDGRKHPKIKGKIGAKFDYGDNPDKYLNDDIEVELNYTTPDKASIDLIKINGEVKWDRSKATEEELSEVISIEVYLDKERLK